MERNLNFDVDVRVNAFECNIRALGGLLSAHVIAGGDIGMLEAVRGMKGRGAFGTKGGGRGRRASSSSSSSSMGEAFMPSYKGGLLPIAHDLGKRLLRAFDTRTGMPYAWVNLRRGVREGEGAFYVASVPARPRAFYLTLVPIRPRRRGERRSLRTFPGASLRPSLAFNPRPRRLSTPLLTPFNPQSPRATSRRWGRSRSSLARSRVSPATTRSNWRRRGRRRRCGRSATARPTYSGTRSTCRPGGGWIEAAASARDATRSSSTS